MTWHESIFVNAVSEPAQRLVELLARRRELGQQGNHAYQEALAAQQDKKTVDGEIQTQEARELALGETGDLKALRARQTKLAKLADERQARAAALVRAVDAIDAEMTKIANDNYDELHRELTTAFNQAHDQYAAAVAVLEDTAAEAIRRATAMHNFISHTKPQLGSDLREIAPGKGLGHLIDEAKALVPGALWRASAIDRWAQEAQNERAAAARKKIQAEVDAGERQLLSSVQGSTGLEEAVWTELDLERGWKAINS